MNRVALYVFYDKDGKVDNYILYCLKEIKYVTDNIIFIVNGYIEQNSRFAVEQYADSIFIRENEGYDAGAYKDIISSIGERQLKKFDQVIFCNDTFYGPFSSLKEIFIEMGKRNVDFWGLNFIHNNISDHIQSYFLVFNKNIIKEGVLIDFFSKLKRKDMIESQDIVIKFEMGLFLYLVNRNYSYSTYIEPDSLNLYACPDAVTYGVPIIKAKCFTPLFFNEIRLKKAIIFLKKHTSYDINLILSSIKRKYKKNIIINENEINDKIEAIKFVPQTKVQKNEIENFVQCHENIYIYGTAFYGKIVYCLYLENQNSMRGFLISEDQNISQKSLYNYKIYKLSEIENEKAGIIVAVSNSIQEEIKKKLEGYTDILYLW